MSSLRIADLAKRYDALAGRDAVAEEAPAFVPVPTAVHRELARMLERLLELGLATANPQNSSVHARALLRSLHSLQPVLVEELAGVPEIRVRLFLRELRDSVDRVLSAPDGAADPGPRAQPRADIAP